MLRKDRILTKEDCTGRERLRNSNQGDSGNHGETNQLQAIVVLNVWAQEGDKFNMQSQIEHLQLKYVGTGHADTTK